MYLTRRSIHGRVLQGETPNWKPLLDLAPEHVEDFMWMFEVELDGGDRLQAYKHWWTRRYLHLNSEGRAFVYRPEERYREVDPQYLLDLVLRDGRALRPCGDG